MNSKTRQIRLLRREIRPLSPAEMAQAIGGTTETEVPVTDLEQFGGSFQYNNSTHVTQSR